MTPTVLLNVDDNAPARYARGRILAGAGFRVQEAGSGQEALDLLELYRPDLVLLDVHLPDIHGLEVCRRIREATRDLSVMILQISASATSPSHAKAALDAGADAYLTEPVDPDVLVATVRAMLRLHKAERSLANANRRLEIVNKELERSNEDLQQFAFAASHDLQEPLRAIATFTEMIEESVKDRLNDTERGYLTNILAGTGRMGTVIRDLLAYSQVGREDRDQGVVQLDQVFLWALANLAEQIEETASQIHLPLNQPAVWGDFAHLGLVFQNLLSNSIKYRNPDQPAIVKIFAEQTSPVEWTIRVKDNGLGIAMEYYDRIFEPFKRLHGSEIPGTGIGLALCRRIVEAHGGRIWVESVLGEGSTFSLTLRVAQRLPKNSQ
jgi:two-component system sensor histidine kinase/response regulator